MKRERMFKLVNFALTAVFIIFLSVGLFGCSHQKCPLDKSAAAPSEQSTPTLYERVGGVNNIAVLVSDVIDRSYKDPVLAANPHIHEAHERYPRQAYKYNATALACQVFGGPQKYTGRTLKEAHQHLHITEKEWKALIRIFRDSMNSFKVPAREQSEVIAILESTKGQVISTASNQ
jgi:hemoglobin